MSEMTLPWLKKDSHLVAKYSYGIYLSHAIVFWLGIDVMHNFPAWVRVLVVVIGSISLPVMIFHWIEDPLIKTGARIAAFLGSQQKPFARAMTAERRSATSATDAGALLALSD